MRVQLDERGRAEALQQRWRLDPFYSQLLLEELRAAQGEATMEARLDQLGVEIRNNLSKQNYFTHVTLDGEAVELDEVNDVTTLARDGRVILMFQLPLIVTSADCTTRIIAADPDPSKVVEAALLDREARAPEGLGRFFAETGEIRCDPP